MRIQTSLPAYMGISLQNSNILDILGSQKKELMDLKAVITPNAHPAKDGIIEIETAIYALSKAEGNSEKINQLTSEASKLRLRFAEIKMDCRDKLKEIISEEQWAKIVIMVNEKMAYISNNSLENTSALSETNNGAVDTIELQTIITNLEKKIQEMSLNNIIKEDIIKEVRVLENLQEELVSLKTK